jgi:hypothetical protein
MKRTKDYKQREAESIALEILGSMYPGAGYGLEPAISKRLSV